MIYSFRFLFPVWMACIPSLAAIQSASNPANNGKNITFRLGGIGPLSGAAASFGQSVKRGIGLAVQEWNANGGVLGVPITLFFVDDQGNSQSQSAFMELIQKDHVSAIVGPVQSGVALAGAPICQIGKVPMITPTATNPLVTQVGDFIFRAGFIDPYQGDISAIFCYKNLNKKRAACLYDMGNGYSIALSESFTAKFTQLGGQVIAIEGHPSGIIDFNTQLRRILNKQPDVLYIPDYFNDAANIVRQARSFHYFGPIVGGDGLDSPDFVKIGGSATTNTYYTMHFVNDDPRLAVKDFLRTFNSKFGPDNNYKVAALAYDATNLMLDAVKQAGSSDGTAIRDALQATNTKNVCGNFYFDEYRNPVKSVPIVKVQDGRVLYFTTVEPLMPKKKSAPVIPSDSQPTAQKAPDPSTILPPVDLHAMAMQGDREAQFKYGLELAPQNTLEGLSWIRKAGEQGHVMAQRVLGNCYNVGNGIPQDHVEAAKWYRKAAEQGDVEGQLMLGSYCFRGDGVPQDYAEAVKWTKKAADQGHPQAQFNFAFCYSSGHGVQQDFAEAAKWYRKSADQGNALAQDFLGQCYQLGQGVTKDDFEAYVWFLVAKANKHMKDAATKLSPQESERAIGRAKILQDEIQARQKKIQQ